MTSDHDHDDDDDDDGSKRPGETDEDAKTRKRKERLEQNRISARESRKRKKTMIEELQRTVITLSRENKDLNERNESLRRQLMEIGAKVRVVAENCDGNSISISNGSCLVTCFGGKFYMVTQEAQYVT